MRAFFVTFKDARRGDKQENRKERRVECRSRLLDTATGYVCFRRRLS